MRLKEGTAIPARVTPDAGGEGDWTAPGTFEVVPGVYRVPLPLPNDGLRAVNVYILARAGDLTLIDSGWAVAGARAALETALAALGCSPGDVRRVLVTHIHRDHYTQATYLRRAFGTRVSLGIGERPSLELLMARRMRSRDQAAFLKPLGASKLARDLAALHMPDDPAAASWELPDDWLRDGDAVAHGDRTLHVVATPGHTRGHVVFHDMESQLLFTGDHVLPTITPSIGLEPAPSADPLAEFLGSLALMRQRPDARLLPAHGPVTGSVHARVDELVAHHGARLDQANTAVAGGAHTAYDVATRLRWTRRLRKLEELDLLNQMLAVIETAAHLQLLVAQGRLTRHDVDGLRCYSA